LGPTQQDIARHSPTTLILNNNHNPSRSASPPSVMSQHHHHHQMVIPMTTSSRVHLSTIAPTRAHISYPPTPTTPMTPTESFPPINNVRHHPHHDTPPMAVNTANGVSVHVNNNDQPAPIPLSSLSPASMRADIDASTPSSLPVLHYPPPATTPFADGARRRSMIDSRIESQSSQNNNNNINGNNNNTNNTNNTNTNINDDGGDAGWERGNGLPDDMAATSQPPPYVSPYCSVFPIC
jgi:hypothetical protein